MNSKSFAHHNDTLSWSVLWLEVDKTIFKEIHLHIMTNTATSHQKNLYLAGGPESILPRSELLEI